MSADTPKYWLDCPDCSCRVFERDEDLFGDSESEHCAACGSIVTISTDAESPLDVRVDEHGGAVVARLLAEVEQLKYEADYTPPPSKVSDVARARIMAALEADCEACVLPSCVPPHTALEVLGAHDDAAREVERLAAERDAEVETEARLSLELTRRIVEAEAEAAHFKAQSKAAHVDAVASANLATAIANRRDAYKKERDDARAALARQESDAERQSAIASLAVAEVERLTETVTEGAKAVSAEQKLTDAALAKVERLTRELDAAIMRNDKYAVTCERRGGEAARLRERVAVLEVQLASSAEAEAPERVLSRVPTDARDLLLQLRQLHASAEASYRAHEHLGPHFQTGHWGGRMGAYAFISARVSLMLDGCTPTGATPSPPDNIEIAWSALRVAASRHGSAPVHGVVVDLHAAYEMALAEARGATPSMTGPEFIAAARKSGLFTAEAVEGIRADIARQRGATPSEPGGES